MPNEAAITEFVNRLAGEDGSYWTPSFAAEMKSPLALAFFEDVVRLSEKGIDEAVLVVLAAMRFTARKERLLPEDFRSLLATHRERILELSVARRVQTNQPERALPVLEVLFPFGAGTPLAVIELGCSLGLIGRCLLNAEAVLAGAASYFPEGQQLPERWRAISSYVGVEPEEADPGWVRSCYSRSEDALRVDRVMRDFGKPGNAVTVKADARGFSALDEVRRVVGAGRAPVVLTSFMMYQLDGDSRSSLSDEIRAFSARANGHWINMDIASAEGESAGNGDFLLSLDGEPIIRLEDDRCLRWKKIT